MNAALKVHYRYVHEDRDRHGNLRVYFRRALGMPKIRMRALPGSPEFATEYDRLLAGQIPVKKEGVHENTLRWLCIQFFASPKFKALHTSTQVARRQVLENACKDLIPVPGENGTFGQISLDYFTSKAVRALRDIKAKAGFPEAANIRVKAIRSLFKWAIEEEIADIRTNPAREVSHQPIRSQGYHTWTEDELRQFLMRHPAGTKAALALFMFSYTGCRRSDVVRIGWPMIKEGWLKFVATKGANRNPITVELPVIPLLAELLTDLPRDKPTFLMTEFGKPFTAAGFGNWFRERCNEAGLPHCSAHGLRKAGAVLAAENGATPHELMSIFGWLTLKEAERYTKAFTRRRMASRASELLARSSPPKPAELPHIAEVPEKPMFPEVLAPRRGIEPLFST